MRRGLLYAGNSSVLYSETFDYLDGQIVSVQLRLEIRADVQQATISKGIRRRGSLHELGQFGRRSR